MVPPITSRGGGSTGCREGCMSDTGIPDSVRRFLAAYVPSIAQLEVLILLRAKADREWSAPEVSGELRSSVMSVQDRLGDLASRGLLVVREADSLLLYRYAPATEDARRQIDKLASAYKERRLAVINLIYAKPESDVASFSEAFKISKKRGDD
jgi:hypothetical protein